MVRREDLRSWLTEALRAYHGSASIVQVCKHVWENHENELRRSGDLFFTWQYDIRWAATQLRNEGIMHATNVSPKRKWELAQLPQVS